MLLGKVLKKINKKYKSIRFKNIKCNSKDCKPNDIFFAIKGNKSNGNNFISEAIKNGAKIIVSNLKFRGFDKDGNLFIYEKEPRQLLSEAANLFYQKKPRNLIAVTGTNGKTSIANFFYQILNYNNKAVATIGTLGVISKKLKLKTANTTIDPNKQTENIKTP
jgi:UDP-N-acetylmuramyl tripeptide synthase